jgi:hypothetical protein
MQPLSDSELLTIWERGLRQPQSRRALTMLAMALPALPLESLERLSIGQRDASVLALRELTFGPSLNAVASCPDCGERLEVAFQAGDVRAAPELDEPGSAADEFDLEHSGYQVRFRPPNSLDLEAASERFDENGCQSLLQRCILDIKQEGEARSFDSLPAEAREALVAQMSRVDPQADVQLGLSCPACQHQWSATFDVVSFFWKEIEAWAYRILRQVHALASAYGWSERDILAMSPWRRQFYLEMVST